MNTTAVTQSAVKEMSVFCCSRRAQKATVAVLNLHGVIESGKNADISFQKLSKSIKMAFDTPGVRAVALSINSPGGLPVQAEMIYDYIYGLSQQKQIPVYAFIEDIGASGGYMLSLAAEEIYASKSSIVGSVGVISAGFGFTEFLKKIGVDRRVVATGENKAILDPFSPVKDSDVEILKAMQTDAYEMFVDLVKSRRGTKLAADTPEMFQGTIYSGKRAKEIGLIDGLGSLQAVMKTKYGANVEFKVMKDETTLLGAVKSAIGIQAFVNTVVQSFTKALKSELLLGKFGQ